MSKAISSQIPKNNENHYWNDFNNITKKDTTEYRITFYNKQNRIEYQYEIRLTFPRYAKVLKGDVQLWQEQTYPLTDYIFDPLLE